MTIQDKIKEYYEVFKGLPTTNPIVRVNQPNDAFEILAYDLLFRKDKYGEHITLENLDELKMCIVPPPDDTIDIFYEEEDGDDYKYHIVQVKNSDLAEADIKAYFASMKRSVDTFLKKRKDLGVNLKNIISETSFDEDNKDCIYYVVHSGNKDSVKGQKKDERIITLAELEIILKSVVNFCVPYEEIGTDTTNNYIKYSNSADAEDVTYSAYQVNINAFDLAVLCNKYINLEIGRNILFGQNLREALTTGSKTFTGMYKTLDNEPKNFWFYNNGITIITESVDLKKDEKGKDILKLKNFSIINGAQTTSAFGNYLKIANADGDRKRKENLRSAYVTCRVVETKDNKSLKDNITIYNNTQNPISSRDMVSNNEEQIQLQRRYLDGQAPYVFIQIRRGESKPNRIFLQKHQVISNAELAQYVFAGFLSSPYTAKDKKNSLFNRDNTTAAFEINKEYYSVFNYSDDNEKKGELFKRSKDEINEMLFVKMLHNKAKKFLKDSLNTRIDESTRVFEDPNSTVTEKESASRAIEFQKKFKQINNVNTFYNIALYFEFKRQFDALIDAQEKKYNFDLFYSRDKTYEQELIQEFASLFTTETNNIIFEEGKDDPPKFTRSFGSQKKFFDKLTQKISVNLELQNKYSQFITRFKI